jgi:hypothetical protein
MAKAVVVRYQTRADAADRTQHLIEQVFAELNAEDPGGIRYAAFRLADGVSFVHIALTDGHSNPCRRRRHSRPSRTGHPSARSRRPW